MSEPKHTPEPWESSPSRNGNSVALYGPIERGCREEIARLASWNRDTNAARIVACVNFCEGTSNGNLEPGGLRTLIFEADDLRAEVSRRRGSDSVAREALTEAGIPERDAEITLKACQRIERLAAQRDALLAALHNLRSLAVPGMNWTDEVGRQALVDADEAIAKAEQAD